MIWKRRPRRVPHEQPGTGAGGGSVPNPAADADPGPSFRVQLEQARRRRALASRMAWRSPLWTLNSKVAGYEFARSHGVPTPRVLGRYRSAEGIGWDGLPEEFVVKTMHGASSRGVLPLVRSGEGYRDLLDEGHRTWSAQEVVQRLQGLREKGLVSAELLVEEMLRAPASSGLDVVPDVKLYCFRGSVGLIMVVGQRFRGPGGRAFRYFSPEGEDLGHARPAMAFDPELPAPLHLQQLVDAGCRLAGAIQDPFVRIDFYEQEEGIVFGEFTPAPGGDQRFREDVDGELGRLWEEAAADLEQAAVRAGLRTPVTGPTPKPIPYTSGAEAED